MTTPGATELLEAQEITFKWDARAVGMLANQLSRGLIAIVGDQDMFWKHERMFCTCQTVSGDCPWKKAAVALGVA